MSDRSVCTNDDSANDRSSGVGPAARHPARHFKAHRSMRGRSCCSLLQRTAFLFLIALCSSAHALSLLPTDLKSSESMPQPAATPDGRHKLSVAARTHSATNEEERMVHEGRKEGEHRNDGWTHDRTNEESEPRGGSGSPRSRTASLVCRTEHAVTASQSADPVTVAALLSRPMVASCPLCLLFVCCLRACCCCCCAWRGKPGACSSSA
jgi:hypothetical protein